MVDRWKIQRAVHKVTTGNVFIATMVVGATLIVVGAVRLVLGGFAHMPDALYSAVPGAVMVALGYLGEQRVDPAAPARREIFGWAQMLRVSGIMTRFVVGLYLLLFSALAGMRAWGPHHESMWKPGVESLGLLIAATLCFVGAGRALRRYLSAPKTADNARAFEAQPRWPGPGNRA
ncbi:hypothetical protein [Mycobacterium sp.]|uniref:hypothetical protein n=1 Tax=Mycobacterium sp. TaxID=1785 RepID=UPI0031D5F189